MTGNAAVLEQNDRKVVVGIAELAVSADRGETIITYALGSCLGLCVYDPIAGVGGMLHAMLPTSQLDPERALTNPARFVDSGVPALFKACYGLGAQKDRMVAKVTGGAQIALAGHLDSFQIGKRNFVALKKLLWKNGVLLKGQDVGGSKSRVVSLRIADGVVVVKSCGESFAL